MKKIKIIRGGVGGIEMTIEAPEDKEMVIDQNSLANGILSIGEYGTSGIKVAAFREWSEAIFDCEDKGYKITSENF